MRDKIKNPAASLNLPDHQLYGSDLIAEALREQRFPYICLNPGASYRGLHDSLGKSSWQPNAGDYHLYA